MFHVESSSIWVLSNAMKSSFNPLTQVVPNPLILTRLQRLGLSNDFLILSINHNLEEFIFRNSRYSWSERDAFGMASVLV